MDHLLTSRPSRLEAARKTLRDRAYWARVAYELDQELGPVPAPVPFRDGESVSEWRARNRAAIEAELS